MSELRTLQFAHLRDAVVDARSLLETGYEPMGNWTLGQICHHLKLVQDPSVHGYPGWMSLFAFLRPAMRRWLLPKIRRPDSPRGIRTAGMFVPPQDVDDDQAIEAFAESVEQFLSHPGDYSPHPAFGRLSRSEFEEIHRLHAAHHLRFLRPRKAEADR
ncbi:DUF1569 domain-containing protein [Rhodopirellula sp. JC740]|uniref:DUF1569 domain-containing protein n=1 Tax=Rhodopirellula halodulae TaxID=2894198 RepID=A0ABS8NGW7_9BACT|nr:DUF1569 domain-containing protein [Rhodopirellula sp. JC740]MCC9642796.1 DUF1569 domain-containing protein [Rhodopirellula sp. JC740]